MKQKRTIRTLRGAGRLFPAALGLALGLLAACTQEETPGGTPEALLTVSQVTIAGEAPCTRAAETTPLVAKNLKVGVRAAFGYAAQRLEYTLTESGWVSSTRVPLTDKSIALYAWYPWEGMSEVGGKLLLANQPYAAEKDLTYAPTGGVNVCDAHPYAGFVLQHVYARVQVDLRIVPLIVSGSSRLESVSLAASGSVFPVSGGLDLITGAVETTPPFTDRIDWTAGVTMASINYRFQGDLLVLPVSGLSNLIFYVMVDGKAWSVKLGDTLTAFESGKSYLIQASLGSDLTVNTVQVEGWNDTSLGSQEMQLE